MEKIILALFIIIQLPGCRLLIGISKNDLPPKDGEEVDTEDAVDAEEEIDYIEDIEEEIIACDVMQVSAGGHHACALLNTGEIMCWGDNASGQLGDGTRESRNRPGRVYGVSSGTAAIFSGDKHTCALTERGSVKCWGENNMYQLGTIAEPDTTIPQNLIAPSLGVSTLCLGGDHTCALMVSGEVKCWGNNRWGQLGNGRFDEVSMEPVDVENLDFRVTDISCGQNHTCALLNTGHIKCWGHNQFGQIGNGSTAELVTIPWEVSDLSEVTAFSSGAWHTCALTISGNIKCWGNNENYQLGIDNSTALSRTPVEILGLITEPSHIASGGHHTCVLTATRNMLCWGNNSSGQLGDGTTFSGAQPKAPIELPPTSEISCGTYFTCALTATEGLQCWGQNSSGQLGDGTNVQRTTPVPVSFP